MKTQEINKSEEIKALHKLALDVRHGFISAEAARGMIMLVYGATTGMAEKIIE